jgi:nucleoside triphosphate pyrophosphatase
MGSGARQLDSPACRREHAPVLVLASSSPRRRELLRWLVGEYAIDVPVVDETPGDGEPPTALVARLARAKAAAVGARRPADWILAADTIVELDGAILGKPANAREARDMLDRLAGREHRVLTGFALLAPGGAVHAEEVVVSCVRFREISPRALAAYAASSEPLDKAGGYAAQGLGAALIQRIEGSVTNVIGLPLLEVERVLAGANLLG